MMIDASALVAILLREPDAAELVMAIADAKAPFTSAIAVYETVCALMRVNAWGAPEAEAAVREFLDAASIRVCAIADGMILTAAMAFGRFGKGRHPAQLNLGDCFAYACAKTYRAPLLHKSDNFPRTDLELVRKR
ncbi:type II toxin-antitoxin system VapC family toxin [Bradyrhizobium sp. USDA 3458]|uniref:type II toxin-antitoxin system VapC family toxin n=1 Tax=Bradyrhizobium sp. USDA 3458 TaxID=2591461 RepID=UPI001144A0EA|nr:type II toxin-antitoxin system VapC family toxin [Bradyrhizobium sp. USDA 3458]